MGTEHSNQTCDPQDDPPREITAQDLATIPKLNSEGLLDDLIEDRKEHRSDEAARVRQSQGAAA